MRLAAFAVGYVVETCRMDCWIESNIGTGVSFYGPGACMCASFWSIRNAGGSLYEPGVTSPAPCFVIRSWWKPMPRGWRRPRATDELQAERSGENDEAHDKETAVRNSHCDAFGRAGVYGGRLRR